MIASVRAIVGQRPYGRRQIPVSRDYGAGVSYGAYILGGIKAEGGGVAHGAGGNTVFGGTD